MIRNSQQSSDNHIPCNYCTMFGTETLANKQSCFWDWWDNPRREVRKNQWLLIQCQIEDCLKHSFGPPCHPVAKTCKQHHVQFDLAIKSGIAWHPLFWDNSSGALPPHLDRSTKTLPNFAKLESNLDPRAPQRLEGIQRSTCDIPVLRLSQNGGLQNRLTCNLVIFKRETHFVGVGSILQKNTHLTASK